MRSGDIDGRASSPAIVTILALLWFSGLALRVTILALPPVLPAITSELQLDRSDIGVLTGLPPLLFALAALPGAGIIARFGAVPTLVLGLVVSAVGAFARGFATGTLTIEATTALMCLGVAVMQPALPPLVRAWVPTRIGLATAVYANGLLVGETLPTAWVPQPMLPLVGGGWRATLVVWALPVVATAVAIVLFRPSPAAAPPLTRTRQDWRDGRVWRSGLVLGGLSATYFGVNGFLPGWLVTNGWPTLVQPSLVALNLAQIPASFLMLILAGRLARSPLAYGLAGALLAGAVVIMVVAPGPATVAAAALAGVACAVLLTLALTLPSLLADAGDVPRLAAAMFTVGFGFAMTAAVVVGRVSEASGRAALAIVPFALTALLAAIAGMTLKFGDAPSTAP